MRKILTICEVLCITGMIAACDVNASRQEDPVEGVVRPSVSTPPPAATGIAPASGWAWSSDDSLMAYQRSNDGTVTFHGCTWIVPIAGRPGDSLSNANFTIEAPTGHTGDPDSILVQLFSSLSTTPLGQISLTPAGLGSFINSNIPVSPPRVVSSGESFELVFSSLLSSGGYPANDTRIKLVQVSAARTRTVRFFPQFIRNTAFASTTECVDGAGVDRLCAVSTGAGSATIAVTYDAGLVPIAASIDVLGATSGNVGAGLTLIYAPDNVTPVGGVGQLSDSGRSSQHWGALSVAASTAVPPLTASSQFFLLVGVDGAGYGIGNATVTFR